MSMKARIIITVILSGSILNCLQPAYTAAQELPNINANKPYTSSADASTFYPDTDLAELTDGQTGSSDNTHSAWSGYESTDVEFTFDLQTSNFIVDVSMNFLSETGAGIMLPQQIDIYVSDNGTDFIHYGKETQGTAITGNLDLGIYKFEHKFLNANNIRFVKISVKGSTDSWTFIDEVAVNGFTAANITAPFQRSEHTEVSFSALLTEGLDVDDLVEKAKSAGAGSISLYVGYSGILWFDSSALKNRYGLLEHYDTQRLARAIDKLHQNNIKVIAVLSSQLWGENPSYDGFPMLQNNGSYTTDLFDPLSSQNFFMEVVDLLMNYNVDGIYVGEPYYKDSTFRAGDPFRNERFFDFYWALSRKIKQRNPKAIHQMLLPNHMWFSQYFIFGSGMRDHGIPDKIKDINFDYIGLDISTIYEWKNWQEELGRFKALLALTNRYAADKRSMAQISIVKFGTQITPIPKEAVLDQISWAKKYGINKLQIFDYQYIDLYSETDKAEILAALKNINNGNVESGPQQLKLLSTDNAYEITDWQKYVEEQINAAGQVASNSLLKIALDQDLFARPPTPLIAEVYLKDGFLTVNWQTDNTYKYNLEVSLDNKETWKELLFFSNPGQKSHTEFIGHQSAVPWIRLRAFDGHNYSEFSHRISAIDPTYLKISAPASIVYGSANVVQGYIWSKSPSYSSANGLNGKNIKPQYRYSNRSWGNMLEQYSYLNNSNNGYFKFSSIPRHNVEYMSQFSGDSIFVPSQSNIRQTVVKARVSISGVRESKYYLVHGTVAPSKPRGPVRILVKRDDGPWQTMKRLTLTDNSRYRYKFYFSRKGAYRIKAFFPGDTLNGKNYSAIKRFAIR